MRLSIRVRISLAIPPPPVSLSLSLSSFSFVCLFVLLRCCDVACAEIFPQVIGREFIRNHEAIYGPFDKCVAEKRALITREFLAKEKEFQDRVKAATPKKSAK